LGENHGLLPHEVRPTASLFRNFVFGFMLLLVVVSTRLFQALMHPLRIYTVVFGGTAIAFAAYTLLRRKPKTAVEIERARREGLDRVGRITDGTVIDVQELISNGHAAQTMLIYKYEVAGVSYEASQDVTYLRQWINLQSCRLGVPTSVRYDPHNPGNSMVISENWMGLRQ